jgi:hypothetical protein
MGVGVPVGAGVPASRGGVPGLGLEPGSVLCCDAAGSPARLKLESAGVCTECRRASPNEENKNTRAVGPHIAPSVFRKSFVSHEPRYLVRNCVSVSARHVSGWSREQTSLGLGKKTHSV